MLSAKIRSSVCFNYFVYICLRVTEEYGVEQWHTSKCSSGGTQGLLRVLALEPLSACV